MARGACHAEGQIGVLIRHSPAWRILYNRRHFPK
jgi:hypothetical protein